MSDERTNIPSTELLARLRSINPEAEFTTIRQDYLQELGDKIASGELDLSGISTEQLMSLLREGDGEEATDRKASKK